MKLFTVDPANIKQQSKRFREFIFGFFNKRRGLNKITYNILGGSLFYL